MSKGRFFLNLVEKAKGNQCVRQVIKTMSPRPPLRVGLREEEGRRKEGKVECTYKGHRQPQACKH